MSCLRVNPEPPVVMFRFTNRRFLHCFVVYEFGAILTLALCIFARVSLELIFTWIPARDTSGVDRDVYRRVLSIPDRDTLKGKRDYALLRLLWENALRRGEVVKADVGDFDGEGRSLTIYGKGQGTQAQ